MKKRATGLKRSAGLTGPARLKRVPMERKRPKGRPAPSELLARQAFRDGALGQRCCAVCWSFGAFDAHHVIEKQWLRQNGLPLWDPRNCLRLCHGCHQAHTSKLRKVPVKKLMAANVAYAYEVMGPYASDYLLRHYDEGTT